MAEYYVIRDKNTGLYFRGKGVNRWGKHYNQASIYRVKGSAEHTIKEISWRGEQAEIVPIQIVETTEDVAPKSEVERLVDKWIGSGELTPDEKTLRLIEQLRDEAKRYERYYFNHEYDKLIAEAKAEVAREIFEEVEESIATHCFTGKSEDYADGMYDAVAWVDSKLAELKKKYTGGESNGSSKDM